MNIKLVKNYNQIRPDRATLFCFPFAGGGASAYNSWVQKMKDKVTVCPIQLPGREERIMEKPYNNMTDMLDELEETIWKCIRGPYAFWGHSMGGKIAYELEKRLEKRGKTAQCFLVSGSRIPSIPERNPIYHLPDDEFKKALGRFEGTPKEILENQELLDFFLPMLRADFTMDETYHDKKLTVLQSPIEAFGGRKDREADEEAMKEWRKYTKRAFHCHMFEVFKRYTKEMTKHKWELLKKIGEKQNITASNILLTAYALMLWEESGSNHFALNITIDKRWNLSKELRHTIGDFTGNILLEIKIDEKKTFIELAHEIQNQLMKDLEHSDFSGIKFQRELSKYDGKKFRYGIPFVYTSTLGMENENDNLFGEICYNITQTPQVWLDYQIQERQGALYLNWDYLQGLLDETQIENMIYKYSNLLDWLIENGDFLISEDNNYQEGIL